MTQHKVADTSQVPAGEGLCVEVGGRQVAIFRIEEGYRAIGNVCPHRGGPLADGMISGSVVTCPWHGWQFDCNTGQSTMNPAVTVESYPVTVDGTSILIEVP